MSTSVQVAIVAALDREVKPAVRSWDKNVRTHDGRTFTFFEHEGTVVVCGGVGAQPARRATEAVIALYQPKLIVSLGYCGALDDTLKVGELFTPHRVVDARDGSSAVAVQGKGTLVSFSEIASPAQKAQLGRSYAAQAVDMEAAAVGRGAETRNLPFIAVKAVSDAAGAKLPAIARFLRPDGTMRTAAFALSCLLQPWLWPGLFRLQQGSSRATRTLAAWIQNASAGLKFLNNSEGSLHPTTRP